MILHLLRALFVLLMAAVGFVFVFDNPKEVDNIDVVVWILPAVALAVLLGTAWSALALAQTAQNPPAGEATAPPA